MKKNLVLGMAKGYDWTTLEPFVTSFARNCPSAELVLFVDDLSDFSRDRLISCGGGILLVNISAEYKTGSIVNTRWKMYCDFLEVRGNDYERVLISDVRDVIFQYDIFNSYTTHKNFLLCGLHRYKIGEEKTNIRWLENLFGENNWKAIADYFVICAGVIFGTRAEMLAVLNKMNDFIKNSNRWGDDQAALNYIIRNNMLPLKNIFYSDDKTGIFINTDRMSGEVRDDKILRGDGGVPALVHQWPAFNHMIRLVDRVYRDRNFQGDERFTDPRSVLEQVKQLLYLGKPDEATRFFMGNQGANFSGHIDRLLNIWGLLLNYPFVPAVGYLELSVQGALASVENLPVQYLNAICSLLIHAIKNRRAVDPRLLSVIAGGLMNIAEQSLNTSNHDLCFFCIDAIKSFDLPPNKDFYLLQAKAYRTFGRKNEALAAYQKALDLS